LQQEPVWTKRELNRLNRLFLKDPAEMFDEIRRLRYERDKGLPDEERRRTEAEQAEKFARMHGLRFIRR
ncbi:MAG: hypothetical protein COZ56_17295, partial [Armatimonadetes bacterium CG_4_8_14_3_um_filter_58_9]